MAKVSYSQSSFSLFVYVFALDLVTYFEVGTFVCGTLLIRGLIWKTLFIMFLSVGHYKFVNLSVRHRTMSSRQKKLEKNLSSRHCAMSHRQIHKFIVSHRQKHDEQCFSDKTTNEGCLTDKLPFEVSYIFHFGLYITTLSMAKMLIIDDRIFYS
jgi:hypothetical protein